MRHIDAILSREPLGIARCGQDRVFIPLAVSEADTPQTVMRRWRIKEDTWAIPPAGKRWRLSVAWSPVVEGDHLIDGKRYYCTEDFALVLGGKEYASTHRWTAYVLALGPLRVRLVGRPREC